MGGSFSKSNAVFVQTDKPFYHDGDCVQALVCLNITEPVTIDKIECKLKGVEHTYWTETRTESHDGSSHTRTEHHGGKVVIIKVKQPLQDRPRHFEPGQYQWPVVFALPVGIPSSFVTGGYSDGANVTYKIKIECHTPGWIHKNIKQKQPITVHQLMQSPPAIVDQNAEREIVSCCCFKQGLIKAHIQLDKDKCQQGEQVSVMLELDNQCKLPVDRVELSLKREITVYERPHGHHRHYWHKEFNKAKHEGVPQFTTLQGSMARRMQLTLPVGLTEPTMDGVLIRCFYFAKVKLEIGSFAKDMKLKVPLVLLAPQPQPTLEVPFYTQPPEFWHATELQPLLALDVPSAPAVPPELLRPDTPFYQLASGGRPAGSAEGAVAQPTNGYLVV